MRETRSQREAGRVMLARGGGMLVAVLAPVLLIWAGNGTMEAAVGSALFERFDAQIPKPPLADLEISKELSSEINQAALDQILIIFLAAAALVAVIGAVMRAATHGKTTDSGKALDFTGKCLALTSGVIVAAAATQRFESAELAVGPPTHAYGPAGAVLLGVVLALCLMGYLIGKSPRKSLAKEFDPASASASAPDPAPDPEAEAVAVARRLRDPETGTKTHN